MSGERIVGWLLPEEGEALARLAAGRLALELGSYEGASTLCLARSAARVHSVDWHRGDAGTVASAGERWTLPAFLAALAAGGAAERVFVHAGRFEDVLPLFRDGSFGLVFVDGAHDEASATRDVGEALRLVARPGTVALHDWPYASVRAAAARHGLTAPDGTAGTLAWFHVAPDGRQPP